MTRNHRHRRGLVALASVVALAAPVTVVHADEPDDCGAAAAFEALRELVDEHGVTGAALSAGGPGCQPWSVDYGVADRRTGRDFDAWRHRTFTDTELVDLALELPPPERKWHYSTTGFVIAGMIAEQVTGTNIGAIITDEVIAPLELSDTYWPGEQRRIRGPHPRGYLPGARYGLGLVSTPLTDCPGRFWGHGGTVPGFKSFVAGTDDGRHVQLYLNDDTTTSAASEAMFTALRAALCGQARGTT